jgi:hypothetical protein
VGYRPGLNARAKVRIPFPAKNQNIPVQPVTSTEISQLHALVIHASMSNDNHIGITMSLPLKCLPYVLSYQNAGDKASHPFLSLSL